MASTINDNAKRHIDAVGRIHGAALDFITFIKAIKGNVITYYSSVFDVPSRVTNLIAQKADFDALAINFSIIKAILEKNHYYGDWTATHTADFNAIFTKAATFRGVVEANINEFPASFNASHQLEYVAASQGVQNALIAQIDDILISVA